MNAKGLIILLCTVTVITAVVLTWWNNQIGLEVPNNNVTHEEQAQGLGATIYESGSNPVADSVPETNVISGEVVNPFDDYKNPFETE